jgi:hypothetical protein
MNLHDILISKARAAELGHFYILEASGSISENDQVLIDFIHQFIKDYYQKVEGQKHPINQLIDHPDVFVLGQIPTNNEEKENAFFSVDEARELGRFFEFRPVQSKRKFAVITQAHRINSLVANKWLKLLEEPQGESTIFLLNPRRQKLLDTIQSRAIHLRIPVKLPPFDSTNWENFLKELGQSTLSQFLENNVKKTKNIDFWIKELIQWESGQALDAAAKAGFEKWLKNYQEMDTFNQPAATKWTLFYTYIKTHVLPRLSR